LPEPDADGSLSDMHGTAYCDSRQAAIAYYAQTHTGLEG